MIDTWTNLIIRLIILSSGACIGLGVSMAASLGAFETLVTVFLSMITVFLANYLGD